jgi:hypothetical protein
LCSLFHNQICYARLREIGRLEVNKLIDSVTYIDFINIKDKSVSAADRNMGIVLEGK